MDDMKRMKASHVKVVDQIQEHYKHIDDDVQVRTIELCDDSDNKSDLQLTVICNDSDNDSYDGDDYSDSDNGDGRNHDRNSDHCSLWIKVTMTIAITMIATVIIIYCELKWLAAMLNMTVCNYCFFHFGGSKLTL